MSSSYYHVSDPLENFDLRVVVRESSKAFVGDNDEPAFTGEVHISWQEKLDSPADIVKNILKSSPAALQKNAGDAIKDVMLYTYVDKDQFWTDKLPQLLNSITEESYLGAAMYSQPADSNSGTTAHDREKKLLTRMNRDKPFKAMHICLATDVDVAALKQCKSVKSLQDHFTEHILCSIKLYQDGLLEVNPGFSGVTIESMGGVSDGFGSQSDECSLSAFLDEETVVGAMANGFNLTTRKIRSKKGSEYKYVIQNMNDLLVPHQIEEVVKQQKVLDARSSLLNKSSTDTSSWKQDPPPKGKQKVHAIYAEIVSGQDFRGNKIFVNYQVTSPKGWDLRTGNLSDGAAEKDIAAIKQENHVKTGNRENRGRGGKGVGVGFEGPSGSDVLALDGYADGMYARGMLYGTTHTATAKDSRRQNGLPSRPHWKSFFISSELEKGSRIFIGFSFFIITVAAVVLGHSYPFWLVPALVIIFTVGTGPPGGTTQVVLTKNEKSSTGSSDKKNNNNDNSNNSDNKSSDSNNKNKNKNQGGRVYSQTQSERQLCGSLVSSAVAHLNHLISLSFDVADTSASEPFQDTPVMHLQVYSCAPWGRHVLEGYGQFKIPERPGSVDCEVRTWRPQGDLGSKMREHFLGSAVRLKDTHFAGVPKESSPVVNRFGMFSESTGSIRIRCSVIVTDGRTAVTKIKPPVAESESSQRRRTVDDILQAFKATGTLRRSFTSTQNPSPGPGTHGGTLGAGSGMTPNRVQGLLTSKLLASRSSGEGFSLSLSNMDPGQSKGDRVAEILSRVRTLTRRLDDYTSLNTSINVAASKDSKNDVYGAKSDSNGSGAATNANPDKTFYTSASSSGSSGKGVTNKKSDSFKDISSKASAISLEMSSEIPPVIGLPVGVTEGKDSSRPVSRSYKGESGGGSGGDAKGDQSPALQSRVGRSKNNRAHRYENSDVIGEEDDADLLGDDAKGQEEEVEGEVHKTDGVFKREREKGRRGMSPGSGKERDEDDDNRGSSENDRLLDR